MKKKTLCKALGSGMLAASLIISPLAGISAQAADVNPTEGDTDSMVKKGGEAKALDPTQDEAIPAKGTEDQEGYVPEKPAYADTEIPVWGFTEDATVYSVDVEWGAMTFQYESSTWDPETHTTVTGAGWRVYDSEADEAVVGDDGTAVTEHAINEIKVTNHSNAGVWAALTYAAKDGYTDTTGNFSFSTGTEAGDTNALTAQAEGVPAYLTLTTADNNQAGGGVGKETVGKAYFMPVDISDDNKANGISKWTTIGTITVGIKTEQPTAATP